MPETKAQLMGTVNIPIKYMGKEQHFHLQVSPPAPAADHKLLSTYLENNRQSLNKAQKAMEDNLYKDLFLRQPPWLLNYESPIQNALLARLNINILIPLINMKGGSASYTKLESFPVDDHIQKMMMKAEKSLFMKQQPNLPIHQIILTSLIVFIIVIFMLSIA
ncbi:MAG: hypothetical protein KAH22_03705 [Thiotrichaceae bacterium]|nr:hypothetical protein [Thiotrichaceae bacterium]